MSRRAAALFRFMGGAFGTPARWLRFGDRRGNSFEMLCLLPGGVVSWHGQCFWDAVVSVGHSGSVGASWWVVV